MNVPDRSASREPYSPHRPTALLLSGVGTAGAYHAGVLRALQEVGVKLDLVAGRGVGAVGAIFAAADGASLLWADKGLWRAEAVSRLYPWRPVLRLMTVALGMALAVLALPLGAAALALVVFPVDFLLTMLGVPAGGGLVAWYLAGAERAFAPGALPTWLPRVVLLVLLTAVAIAAGSVWMDRDQRTRRGPFWWRLVRSPLTAEPASDLCWTVVWDLVRGAAPLRQPNQLELARRYAELLADNLGQPGFRDLLIQAHDLDAGRDLLFALVGEGRRRALTRGTPGGVPDGRRGEVVELTGLGRDHLRDAVAAALTIPLATEPHIIRFARDAFWRGEAHRLYDRPGGLVRLMEELAGLGVEQVLLVSAAPEPAGPYSLSRPRLDGRGRLGEYLQAAEAAAVRDARTGGEAYGLEVFLVRPAHNPIGPLDFGGAFDDRSDRRRPLDELMIRGYEDAYRQFIEPVVAASGEALAQSGTQAVSASAVSTSAVSNER
jgi:hypothetical protein